MIEWWFGRDNDPYGLNKFKLETNTMKTIAEIKQLVNDEPFHGCEVRITSVFPPKVNGQYTNQNCIVEDATGSMYLTFAGKNNTNQKENELKGKVVKFTSRAGKDGRLTGVKFKKGAEEKYNKIWITDTATMEIVNGNVQAGPAQPQNQKQTTDGPQVKVTNYIQSTESSKDVAQRLAKEWVQVFDWTHEVFAKVFGTDDIPRECITGVVIEMRRAGHRIPIEGDEPKKIDWKNFEVKGKNKTAKIGEMPAEVLLDGIVWALQNPDTTTLKDQRDAFMAAMNDMNTTNADALSHVIIKAGVPSEAAKNVATNQEMALDNEEDALKMLQDKAFIKACKEEQKRMESESETVADFDF